MRLARGLGWGALLAVALSWGCSVGLGGVTYDNTGGGGTTGSTSSASGTGGGSTTSTSSTSSASGTGGGGAPDCTKPVSDEFVSGSMPSTCWEILQPSRFANPPYVGNSGELVAAPAAVANNGWFKTDHGPFMFQQVTGDFILVTGVRASTPTQGSPTRLYNAAGLVVRDPGTQNENWVLIDVGRQGSGIPEDDNVTFGVMMKVTTNNNTEKAALPSNGSNHAALAICRRGSQLQLLHRVYGTPDSPHTLGQTVTAPGLSNTLQAGITAGTYVNDPDLVADFAYVRFAGPEAPADCLQAFQALTALGP